MHDIVEPNAGDLIGTEHETDEIDFPDFETTELIPRAGDGPSVAGYPKSWQFTIAVVGNGINKIAQDGDTLICLRAGADGTEPQDGDLVVIQRREDENSPVEIRRLRRIGDMCEFRPETNDPAFHHAPLIYDMRQDNGKIHILGKVLFAYRRLDA